MLPDRRLKHGSRIPLHPQHTYLEENSSGMGLERLASLRMDSGDLSEARLHPEMHPAHRMGPDAYGMRQPWEGPPREGMNPIRGPRPPVYDDEVSGVSFTPLAETLDWYCNAGSETVHRALLEPLLMPFVGHESQLKN